ncbi:MAG: hypothetical protein VSS52_012430 [Thiotrichaceae bacterium]|nr:hypothetical protein [Thiotrichaceae bacterium]
MILDVLTDFKQIAQIAHENAKNKGFWDDEFKHGKPRNNGEILSLIHAEIYELHEALLNPSQVSKKIAYSKNTQVIYEFEEELADILIRLADMVLSRHWTIWDYFAIESPFYHKTVQSLQDFEALSISSEQYDFVRANVICNFFHSCLGQVTEALREQHPPIHLICLAFSSMVRMMAYLETTYYFNINRAIGLKLEYNKHRPHMHNKQF